MQTAQEDFARTYGNLGDDDLAALHAEVDTLTEPARLALTAEIQRRGLRLEQLTKLHATEVRHEAQFDRLERFRRKRIALSRLGLDDPTGWILAIVSFLALILIEELISHHH